MRVRVGVRVQVRLGVGVGVGGGVRVGLDGQPAEDDAVDEGRHLARLAFG